MTLSEAEATLAIKITALQLATWLEELVKQSGIPDAEVVSLSASHRTPPYLYIHIPDISCMIVEHDDNWVEKLKALRSQTELKLSFLDITRTGAQNVTP